MHSSNGRVKQRITLGCFSHKFDTFFHLQLENLILKPSNSIVSLYKYNLSKIKFFWALMVRGQGVIFGSYWGFSGYFYIQITKNIYFKFLSKFVNLIKFSGTFRHFCS